jgi:hypothetical protein
LVLVEKMARDRGVAGLAELTTLEQQASNLTNSLDSIKQQEADLLASDKPESKKLTDLLKLRAAVDIKAASLKAVRSEIDTAKARAIQLGVEANIVLGSIRDGLLIARKARVSDELAKFFVPKILTELRRFAQFAIIVEVESIDRLLFIATNQALSLANCRKLRPIFERLTELIAAEPAAIEFVVSEAWFAPVSGGPAETEVAGNRLGALG